MQALAIDPALHRVSDADDTATREAKEWLGKLAEYDTVSADPFRASTILTVFWLGYIVRSVIR